MTTKKSSHAWSAESLLNKAQRYAGIMLEQERADWRFGFWSVLTLEFVARAALAKFSPTLLAQSKDWNNTYYALGHTPTTPKFVPRSIDIAEVFKRLEVILPEFHPENRNFCSSHMNLRNTELHSGDLVFDGVGTSVWLSEYYRTCQILLKSLEKKLEFLIGKEEAKTARTLILSLKDKAAHAVHKTIKTHKITWKSEDIENQNLKKMQAEALASRHEGHRVKCPSCGNTALLQGSPIGPPAKTIVDDTIVERQSMLPSHFECVACELKIAGYSKLNACDLGDVFTSTSRYDAADYFDVDQSVDMYYEEDFND